MVNGARYISALADGITLLVPTSTRPIASAIQFDRQGHQSHAYGSSPGLVLFGGKGFLPFVKEEQTGFFLMPCYPPNFKNPEVYSSEILNLNSAVDDGSFKYSPTLRGEMSAQVMPVRSLNFSFKRGIKLGFWKRWHSKISMKKKSHSPMVNESSTIPEVKDKCQSSPTTVTSKSSVKILNGKTGLVPVLCQGSRVGKTLEPWHKTDTSPK